MYLVLSIILVTVACRQGDGDRFVELAQEVNAQSGDAKVDSLDEKLMRLFAYNASGDVCPIQAVIGGVTAQEVMKVSRCEELRYQFIQLDVIGSGCNNTVWY